MPDLEKLSEPCDVCVDIQDPLMLEVRIQEVEKDFDRPAYKPPVIDSIQSAEFPDSLKSKYQLALDRLLALGALPNEQGWGVYREINEPSIEASLYLAPFHLDPANQRRRCVEAVVTKSDMVHHFVFELLAQDSMTGGLVSGSASQAYHFETRQRLASPIEPQISEHDKKPKFSVTLNTVDEDGIKVETVLALGSPFANAQPIAQLIAEQRERDGTDMLKVPIRDRDTPPTITVNKPTNASSLRQSAKPITLRRGVGSTYRSSKVDVVRSGEASYTETSNAAAEFLRQTNVFTGVTTRVYESIYNQLITDRQDYRNRR